MKQIFILHLKPYPVDIPLITKFLVTFLSVIAHNCTPYIEQLSLYILKVALLHQSNYIRLVTFALQHQLISANIKNIHNKMFVKEVITYIQYE